MSAQRTSHHMLVALLACSLLIGGATESVAASGARAEEPTLAQQAQTIDPKEVADLLARQASYRVSLSMQAGETATDWEIIIVKEPASQHVRNITRGATAFHYIRIADREWIGLGTDPAWRSGGDPNLTQLEKEGMALAAAPTVFLHSLLLDVGGEASLVNPALDVEGTPCDDYTWTDGEDRGALCLSQESGMPVRARLERPDSTMEAHFSHFNEPANAITAPITGFPDRLHASDARMALNSLASFQWTLSWWWDFGTAGKTGVVAEGTYIQVDQAWRASTWQEEGADGPPVLRVIHIGERRWGNLGGEQERWLPILQEPDDPLSLYHFTDPYHIWRQWIALSRVGDLVARNAEVIDGRSCHEYLIIAEGTTEEGVAIRQETHLFATADAGVPMRIEGSVDLASRFTLTFDWELRHVDDPGNQVEPPAQQ